MEQEVRTLLEGFASDRTSVLKQVRESWQRQQPWRPDAAARPDDLLQHWTWRSGLCAPAVTLDRIDEVPSHRP